MAYPVGYELLCEHFADLPHWQEVRLSFCAHPTVFASDFNHVLKDGSPFCIARLVHYPVSISLGWHMYLYPALREWKSLARKTLLTSGFTALHEFMTHARTHRYYRNKAEVIFDPLAGTCVTKIDYPP